MGVVGQEAVAVAEDLLTHPSAEQVINGIYGLRFGSDGMGMVGKPIGSLGRSPEDALYEWFNLFSEHLSDCADDHDFCHGIYWHEPLQVVPLNEMYVAAAVVVVW